MKDRRTIFVKRHVSHVLPRTFGDRGVLDAGAFKCEWKHNILTIEGNRRRARWRTSAKIIRLSRNPSVLRREGFETQR